MLLISYDISNTKLRTKFSKYLKKFGFRLQYSVFQIKNSQRLLNLIKTDIENDFSKEFKETDSVYIFDLSQQCKITTYGYAKHNDDELIIVE